MSPISTGLRLLVVDDNADAADSLAILLQLWGHEVQVAYTGPEALRVAAAFRPQVVLLDIVLPGMDGYELASRLRQNPDLSEAVLVAITGLAGARYRQRCAEAGFFLHLVKPVDPEELHLLLLDLAREIRRQAPPWPALNALPVRTVSRSRA